MSSHFHIHTYLLRLLDIAFVSRLKSRIRFETQLRSRYVIVRCGSKLRLKHVSVYVCGI